MKRAVLRNASKAINEMSEYQVQPIQSFNVDLEVPGDKSMSHRAAMIAGLANGVSNISGFLPSEDCLNTLSAMRACGVEVEVEEEMVGFGPTRMKIHGRSMKLSAPEQPIDCGNSGTGVRLIMGAMATSPISATFTGDASLNGRPMARVTDPLSLFGCQAVGRTGGRLPMTSASTSLSNR